MVSRDLVSVHSPLSLTIKPFFFMSCSIATMNKGFPSEWRKINFASPGGRLAFGNSFARYSAMAGSGKRSSAISTHKLWTCKSCLRTFRLLFERMTSTGL